MHANRVDEGRHVLEDLKAAHPDSPLLYVTTYQIAEACYLCAKYDTSAELFASMAEEGTPPEFAAKGMVGLGWSRFRMGDYDAAEKMFAQFLEKYPTHPLAADAAIARGKALEHLGRDSAAASIYRQAIYHYEHATQMPILLSAAAHLDDRLGQSEEAIEYYQRIVHQYPNSSDVDGALYGWAWALRDLGRGNDSDKIFRQLHQNYPQSRYWADATYRLAECASQRGDRATATDLLRPLVDGNCPPAVLQHALYLKAQMAISDSRWADAQPPLERLISEFPNSELRPAAEFWSAEAAYRSGDYLSAQQRFDALAQQLTDHKDRWMAIVPLRRAQLLAQDKHWKEARELAETISHDYPDFDQQFEADYLIGRCYTAEQSFDDARAAFVKVVHSAAGGKTETAAMAQWMIGETYFHQENYTTALSEYLRVEVLYPYPRWQAAALLQAGKCHERLGEKKEAAEMYAHMLQKYPQTEFTADASQRLQETTLK